MNSHPEFRVSELELDPVADAELIALIDPRYLHDGPATKRGWLWQTWQRIVWAWRLRRARLD